MKYYYCPNNFAEVTFVLTENEIQDIRTKLRSSLSYIGFDSSTEEFLRVLEVSVGHLRDLRIQDRVATGRVRYSGMTASIDLDEINEIPELDELDEDDEY